MSDATSIVRKLAAPEIIPVVHHRDEQTTFEQLGIARELGADGAFLISHRGEDAEVVRIASLMALYDQDFPVGINLLSTNPLEALRAAREARIPMVWADSFGVDSGGFTAMGNDCAAALRWMGPTDIEIAAFAGVAFKHQRHEPNPAEAARRARNAGFIPTTSGSATGVAADTSRVRAMSEAVNGGLALASGVTPENYAEYADLVSHVLVATGVSKNEYEIDPERLSALVRRNRELATSPAQ